jgi:methionyl-tRNA formyltransferase
MSKKIVFMGTPEFSVKILKSLYQNGYPISTVYTQPPKKSNRGLKLTRTPVHKISELLNIEVRTPITFKNNNDEYEYLKKLDPDLCIVVAFGLIIPEKFLNLSKKGFINIHASILPKYRGAAPIQRSIMNLDKKTGISIMKITSKLDAGPISNIYEIEMKSDYNYEIVSEKLSSLASEKILDEIDNIMEDKVDFRNQDDDKASYAKKIGKSESKINWNMSADKILGVINGLYPSPAAWFNYNGERYKILEAEVSDTSGKTGVVLDDFLKVGCESKSINIKRIQREGKNPQKVGEFMLGSKIKKGSILN